MRNDTPEMVLLLNQTSVSLLRGLYSPKSREVGLHITGHYDRNYRK